MYTLKNPLVLKMQLESIKVCQNFVSLLIFVVNYIDLPADKIKECMGDPEADAENEILKSEQDKQVQFLYISNSVSINKNN